MQLENWGILESFWHKYPDLVEGLDTDLIFREQNLMPATCGADTNIIVNRKPNNKSQHVSNLQISQSFHK
jgi:hypothetical protein